MTGIYMLKNKINNKCYIGQSIDIHRRWIDHKTPSKRNRGTVLGRALTKHGWNNFELIILEECTKDNLDKCEVYYIAKYNPAYNMNEGGTGNKGHRLPVQIKKRLSVLGKRQWESKTDDERKKIIINNLKGPRKGHEVNEETRQKLRLSAKQQFANGMSDEHKNKISASLKGITKNYIARSCSVQQLDKDTGKILNVYKTIKGAAFVVGCHPGNISATCKGRQNTAAGFKWQYHLSSVETIPQGSRAEDELPLEARSNSL
jgi:group I intron endonuclease